MKLHLVNKQNFCHVKVNSDLQPKQTKAPSLSVITKVNKSRKFYLIVINALNFSENYTICCKLYWVKLKCVDLSQHFKTYSCQIEFYHFFDIIYDINFCVKLNSEKSFSVSRTKPQLNNNLNVVCFNLIIDDVDE